VVDGACVRACVRACSCLHCQLNSHWCMMIGALLRIAMSEAVEGADLILFGVSEKYKESANVRCGCNDALWFNARSHLARSLTSARVYVCDGRSVGLN
jgi:hypothetical protein